MFSIKTASYPDLNALTLHLSLPEALGQMDSPSWLTSQMDIDADTPLSTSDHIKSAIRTFLKQDGFKPRGRDKPASEALRGAVAKGRLGPHTSINALVDLCNLVSMHSGLPISVVDMHKLTDPTALTLSACPAETSYVFNPSGQIIDVSHLLCLHDSTGPCASPVKDAQRTKTDEHTKEALLLVWSCEQLKIHTSTTANWLNALLARLDITIQTQQTIQTG